MGNQILIVEDDNVSIEILTGLLKDDYDLFVVKNGKMAIKTIEIKKPDLILLDLTLSDIHGFDVLKTIKSHSNPIISSIPVIITSADTREASELKGLQMGAVDYIFKPFNIQIIDKKIKNQFNILSYKNNLQHLVDIQTQELKNIYNILVSTMSLLVNERDNYTGEHITKVHNYVSCLIKYINKDYIKDLSEKDIEYIIAFSPIHDIGKMSILDSILLKTSSLTHEEFEKMKTHTLNGGRTLRKIKSLFGDSVSGINFAIQIAEYHHEKFDGTGCPYGLKGEDIPLSARIVQICDVYDALTSNRYYKTAFGHKQACEIIINGDGRTEPTHFDPVILEAFIAAEKEFEQINNHDNHLL